MENFPSSQDRQAIVFGGTGFIGSHLVRSLTEAGLKVIYTGRNPVSAASIADATYFAHDSIQVNPDLPSYVFYLTHCGPSGGAESDQKTFDVAIQKNEELLNKAHSVVQKINLKNFVFLSSGGTVYGNTRRGFWNEEDPLNPLSPYGKIKKQCEDWVKNNFAHHTILRPSNIFGAHQRNNLIGVTIEQILNKRPITIFGERGVTRDFLYIDDFVDAVFKVGLNGGAGETFNLGTGIGTNTLTLIEILANLLELEEFPKIHFLPPRSTDVELNILDAKKFERAFRWKPRTSLMDGLRKTIHLSQTEVKSS